MKFFVKKEDLYNGIKIVERATSMKALQPVLLNILIETVDKGTIRLVATDLDLTVVALVDAQVEEEGRITLPSKTLNEIVSKLGDKLITFDMKEGENIVNITCQNSKFDIIGISANEFPPEVYNVETDEANSFDIAIKPLTKAVRQAGLQLQTTNPQTFSQVLSATSPVKLWRLLQLTETALQGFAKRLKTKTAAQASLLFLQKLSMNSSR